MNNVNPMANDVSTMFTIENFAAFEFPLPSSFETRTLEISKDKSGTRLSAKMLDGECKANKKEKSWTSGSSKDQDVTAKMTSNNKNSILHNK